MLHPRLRAAIRTPHDVNGCIPCQERAEKLGIAESKLLHIGELLDAYGRECLSGDESCLVCLVDEVLRG
jgi:hypothetical protein